MEDLEFGRLACAFRFCWGSGCLENPVLFVLGFRARQGGWQLPAARRCPVARLHASWPAAPSSPVSPFYPHLTRPRGGSGPDWRRGGREAPKSLLLDWIILLWSNGRRRIRPIAKSGQPKKTCDRDKGESIDRSNCWKASSTRQMRERWVTSNPQRAVE